MYSSSYPKIITTYNPDLELEKDRIKTFYADLISTVSSSSLLSKFCSSFKSLVALSAGSSTSIGGCPGCGSAGATGLYEGTML